MSDCIAGEASDQEWSLVQLVEQSEAEFGQLDSDTLPAKHNLAVFYEGSETFVKVGVWAEYMAKTDKERLATGFWNRIESNQATDCNTKCYQISDKLVGKVKKGSLTDAIASAARYNRLKLVDMLFSAGAMANARNHQGLTPLHGAALNLNKEMACHLLRAGADVNAYSHLGRTPLHEASARGGRKGADMLRLVRLLISEGGNALILASIRGLRQIVQLLLDHGADVHAQVGPRGDALQAASSHSNEIEVPKLLLANGADVNAHGGDFVTPLGSASRAGHDQVVQLLLAIWSSENAMRLLLASGVDVDAQDDEGYTELYIASRLGHGQLVNLRLANGADVNLRDKQHHSALKAVSYEGRSQTVELLLANKPQESTIRAALTSRHPEIILMLLDEFINICVDADPYSQILDEAASTGNDILLQELIDRKVLENASALEQEKVLVSAISAGHKNAASLLISAGVNDDPEERTLLHTAVHSGQLETMQMILALEKNINRQEFSGPTALGCSAALAHHAIVVLLLEAGTEILPRGAGPYCTYFDENEWILGLVADALIISYLQEEDGNENQAALTRTFLEAGAKREPESEYTEAVRLIEAGTGNDGRIGRKLVVNFTLLS
ncbi:hypothetical protein OEA41_004670 [Lepraria neglecta]|uniref:Ankyrin n=1 Tax=Lepraria neglecta TaxID=209136 RepID=A0AAD9YY10_9LECA|nr:hypothetical protein OEA41_004670 [Lepraria neglecta]